MQFDSGTASARLSWGAAVAPRFCRYEVQRQGDAAFATVAVLNDVADTTYVDSEIQGNQLYRYRVAAHLEDEGGGRVLLTPVASGGVYLFAGSWPTGGGGPFQPTRLAVDSQGCVYATGIRSGRVACFTREGEARGELVYAPEPVACLAPGALDGPVLAIDSQDNVYVAYNVPRRSDRPEALWSKFTSTGELAWTKPLGGLFVRHITIDEGDRVFVESISQVQQFTTEGEVQQVLQVPALLVASLRVWQGRFAALIEPMSVMERDWRAARLVVYEAPDRTDPAAVLGRDPLSERDRGDGLLVRPTDFAVEERTGRAFVVNAGLDRIEVFAVEGFQTRWGKPGNGPGEFAFEGEVEVLEDIVTGLTARRRVRAGGVACDAAGRILVADTFNDRIQVFSP